jgi:hypothetical protein
MNKTLTRRGGAEQQVDPKVITSIFEQEFHACRK